MATLQGSIRVCIARLWKKRTAKQYLENRSGERNADTELQVQLEEDGVVRYCVAQDRTIWRQVFCG